MNYSIINDASPDSFPTSFSTDCVVVSVFKKGELSSAAKAIDEKSSGAISALIEMGDFTGSENSVEVLYNLTGIEARRVMLVGCGDKDKYDLEVLHTVMDKVGKSLNGMKLKHAAIWLEEPAASEQQAVQQAITTLSSCFYTMDDYKSDKKKDETEKGSKVELSEIAIAGAGLDTQAINQGMGIASGVELAKNMANHPGNVCTPTYLAENALQLGKQHDNLSVEILEESDMEALGMGAFLSVSVGSREDGKLIIMNYSGGSANDKPVVLVGKGITFDTGGISLKPGGKMDEMKFDMGGAASVLGTMQAIASMELPMNVIGVIASAENMPSGHATKPGDIVTSMAGKTIEVLNTDAEGRMVLCDALTYVKKFDPEVIIDIATLTGACIVALGHHICGMISNNDSLAKDLMEAGENALDQTWRLPHNKKYTKQLKSEFADLANIGGPSAGAITAGCFLAEFVDDDMPWAHLDVAGTAWTGKAATGRPVPLLTQYLINRLK
ncbi:MAG: leucyl aminopeptidase [Thiotrichaceae bacterium]